MEVGSTHLEFWIEQHAERCGLGDELMQQFQPFCLEVRREYAHPRDISPRAIQARREALLDRISADRETIGIVVVAAVAAK